MSSSKPQDDVTEASSSDDTEIVFAPDDEVTLLGEIVCASNLVDCEDVARPFCEVMYRNQLIHRTTKATEGGSNPIWTISSRSLFLVKTTPRLLAHYDMEVSISSKRKDPLNLATLKTCFHGKAILKCDDIVSHCDEERFDVPLKDEDLSKCGTVTLRFRLATPDDVRFVELVAVDPELLQKPNKANDIYNSVVQQQFSMEEIDDLPLPVVRPVAKFVTEKDETKMAGKSIVNALSSAFVAKSYYEGGKKMKLVKPGPDPKREKETVYMTPEQIQREVTMPSQEWVEAGSGDLGRIYLEILSCHGLPNVDVGEAMGNVTDPFVCAVHEDAMVQTPVIDDELSPHWMPWTRRAFIFGMLHPASMLYLGVFDFDLGMSDHENIGRVAVNLSSLQRDTDYDLRYNLYPSSNVTDRISAGSIRIRVRVEYLDEKRALLEGLNPRPTFHVNVKKEKSLKVVHYTCYGEYGEEKDQKFDLTVTRSLVNELLGYKNAVLYCVGDTFTSLVFWRGQVKIFDMLLPVHSILFFTMMTNLVENPQVFPSCVLLTVAWMMLATQRQRDEHPSPWHRCPSFWQYVHILWTGKSSLRRSHIEVNDGVTAAIEYEEAWRKRLEHDLKIAERKAALAQEITTIGNDDIQTKVAEGQFIPIDLLDRLARYQGILGRFCGYGRFVKLIVTWEDSIISFWLTACFLVTGLVSLLFPWSFILLWTSRALVWGCLGPHMMVVDHYLTSGSADKEEVLKTALEKFQKDRREARARYQAAIKLKDIKSISFGKYITLIPNQNLSRHCDTPLPSSSAIVHCEKTTPAPRVAREHVPGQQFFGSMIPRTCKEAAFHRQQSEYLTKAAAALACRTSTFTGHEAIRTRSESMEEAMAATDDCGIPQPCAKTDGNGLSCSQRYALVTASSNTSLSTTVEHCESLSCSDTIEVCVREAGFNPSPEDSVLSDVRLDDDLGFELILTSTMAAATRP